MCVTISLQNLHWQKWNLGDFKIVIENWNILEDYSDKKAYKNILQYIGRKDFAKKLEIYLAVGQQFCLILVSKYHYIETTYGFP